jgi:tetratricopeptide (TPR) repeat protein
MGDAIGYVKPARGIAYIQKALALLDPLKEPRLQMYAQHDLALFLTENGQAEEALAVLERARPLFEQFWDDLTQLRLHWVEGKIADRLGNFDEAESILIQLWDEFRARDLSQEVVLVTIDLAQVLVKKGDLARAAQLAVESYSILRNWGLRQDALAAWVVFQEALSQGKLAGDLFSGSAGTSAGIGSRRAGSRPERHRMPAFLRDSGAGRGATPGAQAPGFMPVPLRGGQTRGRAAPPPRR